MRFDQWVKKHTKGLFTFILVAMAVPLIINFGPGGCDPDPRSGEGGSQAGVIFDGHSVSRADFIDAREAAYAYHRWKFLSGFPMPKNQIIETVMRQGGRWWNDPKPEELEKLAWERIALRRWAEMCGVTASKEEARAQIEPLHASTRAGASYEYE